VKLRHHSRCRKMIEDFQARVQLLGNPTERFVLKQNLRQSQGDHALPLILQKVQSMSNRLHSC